MGFDAAVGIQRSLRTALLLARAQIPQRVGYGGSPGAWLYHQRVPKEGAHARDRLVGLAGGLGIDVGASPPDPHLDVDPVSAKRVSARLDELGCSDRDLLVVAPGSAWATKQWPAKRFGEAAARLVRPGRDRVVVIGMPHDRPLAAEIATEVAARGGATIDATGETSIADAVAWIARARLVLANDSAPAHIAAALGRPVVTMFGPTVPAQGFAPLGDRVRIVERRLDCRPCSRHGGDRCPIGTHECLAGLDANEVVTAGTELLSGSAAK
jgi:heptosyltransferase-2